MLAACCIPCANRAFTLNCCACAAADDLGDRGVPAWVLGFAGVTHALDVYSGARVEKRIVFPST
jgi:hypothetical protein